MTEPPFPTAPGPFLWRYIRHRLGLSLAVLAVVIGGAIAAVGAQYGMKLLVDGLSAPDRDQQAVWWRLALFLGLIAAENALWRLGGWFGSRAVVKIGVDVRLEMFEYLIGHASGYFSEHMGGALANRVTATAAATTAALGTLIWNVVPPTADLMGSVFVLTTIDWRIAAVLFVTATLVAACLGRLAGRGQDIHRAYYDRAAHVGGEIVDVLANNWIVKAFSGRNREFRRLRRKLDMEAITHRRSWMFVEKMRVLHDLFLWLIAAAILIYATVRWSAGAVTTGDVVLIATISLRILHGSRDIALSLVGVGQNLGAVREALAVIGTPYEIADPPAARRLTPMRGEIRFEHVTFRYPGREPLLADFSLVIAAGQSVGIVGPSGVGKTTLIRLVQRLDEVERGRILVDGQAIDEITQDSLRAAIAVVPQEISLFNRTIVENIRYGRPAATDDEVLQAAMAARCHDFIQDLPEGYRTLVGERGVKLSGGQRQRIGIARAILKDAPIIILDEATASLDTESEIEIKRAIDGLIRHRTLLAVAHRLSTVGAFDRILFLRDGRIVEDGPPAELRRRGGQFARMWRLQTEQLATDNRDA